MNNSISVEEEKMLQDLLQKLVAANFIDMFLTFVFFILILILHIKFHQSWKIDLVLLCIGAELSLYSGAMYFSSVRYLWNFKIIIHIVLLTLFLYLFVKIFSVNFIIFFFLLLGLNIGLEFFNRTFLNDCIIERRMLFTTHKERKEIIYKMIQDAQEIDEDI